MTIARLTNEAAQRLVQAPSTSNNSYRITKQDQERDVKHSYFLRGSTSRYMGHHQRVDEKISLKSQFLPINSLKRKNDYSDYEEDLAKHLVMLSDKATRFFANSSDINYLDKDSEKAILFQCKRCKKHFSSHQALGGHRASHKKVKGCFASNFDDPNELSEVANKTCKPVYEEEPCESSSNSLISQLVDSSSSKVHECSICHRVFASGQALGGHKRCHWLNSPISPPEEYGTSSYTQSLSNFLFYSEAVTIPLSKQDQDMLEEENDNVFSKQNQDQDQDQDMLDEEKSEVVNEYSVKHENCGITDIKKEGVCASWLQIGIASSASNLDGD